MPIPRAARDHDPDRPRDRPRARLRRHPPRPKPENIFLCVREDGDATWSSCSTSGSPGRGATRGSPGRVSSSGRRSTWRPSGSGRRGGAERRPLRARRHLLRDGHRALPFDAADIPTFFVKHLKEPPPSPRKLNPQVPRRARGARPASPGEGGEGCARSMRTAWRAICPRSHSSSERQSRPSRTPIRRARARSRSRSRRSGSKRGRSGPRSSSRCSHARSTGTRRAR